MLVFRGVLLKVIEIALVVNLGSVWQRGKFVLYVLYLEPETTNFFVDVLVKLPFFM